MYLLIVFLPLLGSSVAGFFVRYLGSEGTARMITGGNMVIFSIVILGCLLLFRLYFSTINKKYGFKSVFILYLFLSFLLFFSFFFLRISLLSHLVFALPLILCVSGGHPLPAPSPSGSPSPSSWTEFDTRVLLEPFSDTEMEGIISNRSMESSMRARIYSLANAQTPFLLDKEGGEYWRERKATLGQAPSQKEYNRLLEFENRDLQIREQKHTSFCLFKQILSETPALAERAPYNPQEAFIDFLTENEERLDKENKDRRDAGAPLSGCSVAERDRRELLFLDTVGQDLREQGPHSIYIRGILGS